MGTLAEHEAPNSVSKQATPGEYSAPAQDATLQFNSYGLLGCSASRTVTRPRSGQPTGHHDSSVSLWGSRTRPRVLAWASMRPAVFADEAAEDGPALDPLPGEISHGVVGPGRAELAAAMGRRPLEWV